MALWAIGDLHLCRGADKPMDVFGGNWQGYMQKLERNLSVISPEDTTVLLGDLSWALGIEQAKEDFAFIDRIPGRKIILKGNHDYWWNTASKMKKFFAEKGFDKLELLHNNCCFYGETALCGTRGWFFEEEKEGVDRKVFNREVMRLEASLKANGEALITGALTDTMVMPLLKSGVLRGGRLVVMDPSKVLLTADALDKLATRSVRLETAEAARTLCVTVNPVSAYGWKFDKDKFMAAMQEAVDAPVINVKEELA